MENRDVVLARESSSHNGVATGMGVIAPDIIPLLCVLQRRRMRLWMESDGRSLSAGKTWSKDG